MKKFMANCFLIYASNYQGAHGSLDGHILEAFLLQARYQTSVGPFLQTDEDLRLCYFKGDCEAEGAVPSNSFRTDHIHHIPIYHWRDG